MTYDCMTAEELALWRQGAEDAKRRAGYLVQKPCSDCPMAFRKAEREAGRCRLPDPSNYEMTDARRAYKAEWMRLWRARQAAA